MSQQKDLLLTTYLFIRSGAEVLDRALPAAYGQGNLSRLRCERVCLPCRVDTLLLRHSFQRESASYACWHFALYLRERSAALPPMKRNQVCNTIKRDGSFFRMATFQEPRKNFGLLSKAIQVQRRHTYIWEWRCLKPET
jgi:hypothetical protein